MRFIPIGRPIRPRPINPIFLGPAAGSKRSLLDCGGREARRYFPQKEETIVAELGGRSSEGDVRRSWGAEEREDAWRAAGRRSGSGAQRLVVRFGRDGSFGYSCGRRRNRGRVHGSSWVRLFFDAHQILIGNFPAKMPVLAALLEVLFKEDGAAGIGDKGAGGGQKNIASAILHFNPAPQIG